MTWGDRCAQERVLQVGSSGVPVRRLPGVRPLVGGFDVAEGSERVEQAAHVGAAGAVEVVGDLFDNQRLVSSVHPASSISSARVTN